MIRVLNLGAGVQSSTVLLMIAAGEIPMVDAAIFADTGWEPAVVYSWLDEVLEPAARAAGIPLHRVSHGNIRDDIVLRQVPGDRPDGKRWSSIPMYTRAPGQKRSGMLRRQCTREYKIAPIHKKVRELCGLAPRQRAPRGEILVEQVFGISFDEVQRMRGARSKWIRHDYPLVDRRMTRQDCKEWMKSHGYPEPPRSACLGCPFHSDREWRSIKDGPANEWEEVVAFDRKIRHMHGMTARCFIHRSCKPIDEVDLRTESEKGQGYFAWMECEGMCGV